MAPSRKPSIRKIIKKTPLSAVLVVPFIIQIVGAVGIVGYLSFQSGQQAVDSLATELSREVGDRTKQKILSYLDDPNEIIDTVITGVEQGNVDLTNLPKLEQYFWSLVDQKLISCIQIGFPDGTSVLVEQTNENQIVAATAEISEENPKRQWHRLGAKGEREEFLKSQEFNPTSRPWYKAGLEAKKSTWSSFFTTVASNYSIVAIGPARPIYTADNQLIGVLHGRLDMTRIHDFLKKAKVGRTGQVFLIDRSGDMVASSRISQPFVIQDRKVSRIQATQVDDSTIRATAQQLLKQFGSFNSISNSQSLSFIENGQRYLVQVSPIQDDRSIDWLNVVVVPDSDFTEQIHDNLRRTILLCLATLLTATVLGLMTARWISNPLLCLSQASEEIAAGNLNQIPEMDAVRELEVLLQAFNRMSQQLKESFTDLEQVNQELEMTNSDLKQSQLQLVQSEKMSALGALVAGIAHEINNPVGFIAGNIYELQTGLKEILEHLEIVKSNVTEAEIREHAEEIDLEYLLEDLPNIIHSMETGCTRIQELSTSLRTFSRADSEKTILCNLHEGIDSTLLILKHRIKANNKRPTIEIVTDYAELPEIECFPGQLNQVFMNILANAIDMFDEMAEQYEYKDLEANPQKITIQTALEQDTVTIHIRDNGKGMSDEVKARIFDHLYTTKAVGKGTGLGLAIAHQIMVEKHSGSIQVNSAPGQGTEFALRLSLI
jgi:signal transduction histidine kinase